MDSNILILRADADAYTGTGHFMRLLALGQGWKEVGGKTVFVTRCTNKSLLSLIQKEGFEIVSVPSTHPDARDLQTTLATLEKYPQSPIVIDGYTLDSFYQQALMQSGHPVCTLDDMAHMPRYFSDLLVNQNPGAEKLKYQTDAQCLLGTQYTLLRREFRKTAPKQVHSKDAKNVLVLMGGADVFNLNPKILTEFAKAPTPKLHIKVVCGAANPNEGEVTEAAKNSPHKIEILKSSQEMEKLMAWSDIAVSAAGSTALELSYMGVPSLLLVLIENQEMTAKTLHEKGAAIGLGHYEDFQWDQLVPAVHQLLSNHAQRESLSAKAKALIDGQGIHRIIQPLLAIQSTRKSA